MSVLLDVGANIRAIRSARGQNVEEFAAENGWTRQQVSLWELGKRDLRLSNLSLVAEGLGVRVSDLVMGLEDKRNRSNGVASLALPFDQTIHQGTIPEWFLQNLREELIGVKV